LKKSGPYILDPPFQSKRFDLEKKAGENNWAPSRIIVFILNVDTIIPNTVRPSKRRSPFYYVLSIFVAFINTCTNKNLSRRKGGSEQTTAEWTSISAAGNGRFHRKGYASFTRASSINTGVQDLFFSSSMW